MFVVWPVIKDYNDKETGLSPAQGRRWEPIHFGLWLKIIRSTCVIGQRGEQSERPAEWLHTGHGCASTLPLRGAGISGRIRPARQYVSLHKSLLGWLTAFEDASRKPLPQKYDVIYMEMHRNLCHLEIWMKNSVSFCGRHHRADRACVAEIPGALVSRIFWPLVDFAYKRRWFTTASNAAIQTIVVNF